VKTLILGGGAVGSVLGGYLSRGGRDVTIADGWFQHVEAVRKNGLTVQSVEGEFTARPRMIHLDELRDAGTADLVIVAGKAYDTRLLTLLAREHLHEGTVVMSSQNGMNDAILGDLLGRDRVVACVVALGADLLEPGVVRRSSAQSAPSVVVGRLFPEGDRVPEGDRATVERIGAELEPLGGVEVVDDAWPDRWGKLTLNTMSNALAGLTGLWSDRLWSEPESLDVMVALGHETASIAAAEGVAATPVLKRIPQRMLLDAVSVDSPAWAQAAAIMRDISAGRVGTRANRASLLQDVMKGRRTEVDYLNGWVARRGMELGVPTPTHELLVRELRPVEAGDRLPAVENAVPILAAVREWYRG